ncbi:MAG: hypothetical protein EKK54_06255 [Neisseriaceae bacterium]|nr:MAG: hypothetical protein EKK54_06255 [Neisseriaceae bacterium]
MTNFNLDETLFDEMQLNIIKKHIDGGYNPESFANPKYDWTKMQVAAHAVRKGIDISKYLDTFPSEQLDLIRLGISRGLDIEQMANPAYSFDEMYHKLLILEYNKNGKTYDR